MKKRILARVMCFTLSIGIFSSAFIKNTSANEKTNRTFGRDYYVSSINGDNNNDGSAINEAWQTLDKINEIELQPGDRVLLEAGSVFTNGYLHIKGSGSEEYPIEIDKYGEGENPRIDTNGQGIWYQDYGKPLDSSSHKLKGYVSSSILLYDVEYIHISNLEITNKPLERDAKYNYLNAMNRTGIAAVAQNKGTIDHIYLDGLNVHDVMGNVYDKHMNNGGIYFTVFKPNNEAETGISRYNDIKIENCIVNNVNRWGIAVGYTAYWDKFPTSSISDEIIEKYGSTGVEIRNNYIKDAGGDAITTMYCDRPIIEYNVSDGVARHINPTDYYETGSGRVAAAIWPWKCKDAIFQYNEAFDTCVNQDGQAWDADYGDGTIYQYNYSHNNGGGAVMICGIQAVNSIFRYNISENDLAGVLNIPGNPDSEFYNNVFYMKEGVPFIRPGMAGGTAVVRNNIIYNAGTEKSEEWTRGNSRVTYSNNIYYNYTNVPTTDAFAITEDPKFINPGNGPTEYTQKTPSSNENITNDLSAFAGYKIADDSPAVNTGVYIPRNTDKDFFGNKIGLIPDIGIHEVNVKDEGNVRVIYSDIYKIKDESIDGIGKNTSVKDFISRFKYSNGTKLEVFNETEEVLLSESEFVKNRYILKVTFADGTIKKYTIFVEREFLIYPTTGMTANDGSHQTGNSKEGPASFALDGDLTTMWHTNWNGCKREEAWISIDMGKVQPISMLKYTPRGSIANGIITKYAVYVKEDINDEWIKIKTQDNIWERSTADKYAYFDIINTRFVKLHAEESYTTTSSIYASAAEIRLGIEKNDEEGR